MEKIETILRDDQSLIPARIWIPDHHPLNQIQGIIHICHGVAEHSARYRNAALALNQAKYIVISHDHRGHGLSISKNEELGHFANQYGWQKTVRDLFFVHKFIRKTFPDKPLILLGHSMGSFISMSYLQLHPKSVAAFIGSGSAYKPPFICKALGLIAKAERMRLGVTGKSKWVDKIAFLGYNKKCRPQRTQSDWISRDISVVDQYKEDPKCNFICTAKLWEDFAYGLVDLFTHHQFNKLPKNIPYYFFGGDKDPVSLYGKQLKELSHKIKHIGAKNIEMTLYKEGRHEMLNEINAPEVLENLIDWLNKNITKSTTTFHEVVNTST